MLTKQLNRVYKDIPSGAQISGTMEMKVNGFTVDLITLTVVDKVVDNGEDVCSKIEDSNFRSFCLNSFDKNKDGRVSLIEASEVKTIKVPGKGIHSLAGIECFKNLTSLACNDNHLTQLDVSKNTKLKMLSCNENQLTQLDVSKNTSLEDFGCSHNQLSFLDVSKNAALQQLFCGHNQLSKLNVSGCSALKKLACDNNQLTSLDISGATALEELVCDNNQLSNLDISRNSVLWSLICKNNQLPPFDKSKYNALTYLVQDERHEGERGVMIIPDDRSPEGNRNTSETAVYFSTPLDVFNFLQSRVFKSSDGITLDISPYGVTANGRTIAGAVKVTYIQRQQAIMKATSPSTGHTYTFIAYADRNCIVCDDDHTMYFGKK